MNYYFLTEDSHSLMYVLPKWLEAMRFNSKRVADISYVENNNYVLQSGHGVTQLITHALFDTIDTIRDNPGKINKLVIILDVDDIAVSDRITEVNTKIREKYMLASLDFEIVILVCNHCFETWLLGHSGLYPTEAVEESSQFYRHCKHYNVSTDDPEDMTVPPDCDDTISQYHFHYLHDLFLHKRIRYRKSKPDHVASEAYLDGMLDRINTTDHIGTFKSFVDFVLSDRAAN